MLYSWDMDDDMIYIFEVSEFRIQKGEVFCTTPFSSEFKTKNSIIKDKRNLLEIVKNEPIKMHYLFDIKDLPVVFYRFGRIAKLLCSYGELHEVEEIGATASK